MHTLPPPVLTRVLLSVFVFCRRWHGSSPPLSRARCCSVAGLSAAPSSTARAIASSATSPSRGRGPLMAAWTTALRIASSGRSATAAASRRGCSARSRRPAPASGTIIRCGCRSRTRRHVPQTVRGEERRTMRRRKSSACEAALCERRVRCGKEATVCSSFLGVYTAVERICVCGDDVGLLGCSSVKSEERPAKRGNQKRQLPSFGKRE